MGNGVRRSRGSKAALASGLNKTVRPDSLACFVNFGDPTQDRCGKASS